MLSLTISNIPIKCQNGRSGGVTCLCVFPVGGEGRRFFPGILISPRLIKSAIASRMSFSNLVRPIRRLRPSPVFSLVFVN
jgi:hypothetical protein